LSDIGSSAHRALPDRSKLDGSERGTAEAFDFSITVSCGVLDRRETGGHPYVAQVILAEAERTGNRIRRPRTLMATKDEILGALLAGF
jgi:hypothetical protein